MQNWKQILCWSGVAGAASLLAACSGTLGDGVDLESITVRTLSATLDVDGNAADNNLVVGQCIPSPLFVSTLFSDGEQSTATVNVTWTADDDGEFIAIDSNGLLVGIKPTPDGQPVTVTAEFAGRTDSALVSVLPSSLVLDLANTTFAVGVDTQISAVLEIVGSDTVLRPSANGVATFEVINDNMSDPVAISSFDADNNLDGLSFGALRASGPGSATVNAKLNVGSDAVFAPCSEGDFATSLSVVAEEPDPNLMEVVPEFVSSNAANQSSAGMLFLANNTGANVVVNAVFSNGQRQELTAGVGWTLTNPVTGSDGNEAENQLLAPSRGSGLIRADNDDSEISEDPILMATFIRGVADTSPGRDPSSDLTDLSATVRVDIEDYAAADVSLAYEPQDGGVIPFSASTPYRVIASFGDPDRDADVEPEDAPQLVLDLTNTFNLVGDDGNDSEDLTDFISITQLNLGTIGAISKETADNINTEASNGGNQLVGLHPVMFSLTIDPDADPAVDGVVSTTPADYERGDSDLENIQPGDVLQIALGGEQQAAPDDTVVCIEQNSSQQFDALLQFENESDGATVLPALVTSAINPTPLDLGSTSMPGTVWSITNPGSFTVSNSANSGGLVTVIGDAQGSATLTASYVNLTPNTTTEIADDNTRIARQKTIEITSATAGNCPDS